MSANFRAKELKRRVLVRYGAATLRDLPATPSMFLKLGVHTAIIFGVYANLLRFDHPSPGLVVISILTMAASMALLFTSALHDLVHGTLIRGKKLRRACSYLSDLLGASHLIWHNRHNRAHHYHTNDVNRDEDLQTDGALRFSGRHEWKPHHRAQAFLAPLGYLLYAVLWFYFLDAQKFLRGRVMHLTMKGFTPLHSFLFILFKFVHVGVFALVPYLRWGGAGVAGYLATISLGGFIVVTVNQVAHVFIGTRYHDTAAFPSQDAFFLAQIETTASFAPRSKTWARWTGGINLQLAHHLFPDVPHAYLPGIQAEIERYADECGVRLNSFPTLRSALRSHYRELHRLGKNPKRPPA